jgi:hypothetical protein
MTPPKPIEVKRRQGNPGKRALPKPSSLVALPRVEGIPEPLRTLDVDGAAMWGRVWSSGAAWVAPTTDVELVQMVCEAADERSTLRALVMSGESDWRDRVALRSLDSDIRSMLSALGFTPVDRTRMGVGEVREVSKLEALRARRAK